MGPSRVGEWEVEGELARGGQGVVLRARHAVHRTPAALKVLLRIELRTTLRFRQEAAVLLRLNHPNLVRVYEVGEHDGRPFLAMELVEGQSLADLVREGGPPPFERAARLLAAVARAVHHCHGQGVVHRDLKPENVIVERGTDRPVVVDFGLVKRDRELFGALSIDELSRLSRSGELRGTPLFMAPEQVDPAGDVGPWTDVHALGAVLHVLLTGEPPYDAGSLVELLQAVASEPPADPRVANPAVPAPLAQLCLQARAKARDERPRSAAAFAAALEAALARPAGRRGKAPVVAAGLLLLGGGAAAVVVARGRGQVTAAPEPAAPAPVASAPPASPTADELVERALGLLEDDPAQARALADEALALDPGRLRARGARAVALLELARRGAESDGQASLQEMITADPTLGWASRPGGGPDPRLADAWACRGLRRFQDGDLDGALADAEQLLALHPGDATALLIRGQVRLEGGDAAGALVDLDAGVARAPRVARLWLVRAEARLRLGDAEGALQDVAEALRRDPAEADHLCTAARALSSTGRHAEAVEALTRALAGGADEVFVRALRAIARLQLGAHAEALADAEAALALAPRNARALSARALARWVSGAPVPAAADFAAADRALAELAPAPRAGALVERARLRHGAGDVAGALADVDQAVALAPDARSRTLRAELLVARGRVPEALAELDLVPASPGALIARAMARQKALDHAAAVADLDRALALPGVEATRALVLRASSRLALRDLAAASADATRAIELDGRRSDGWIARAQVRSEQGDLRGALADLDEAVARSGPNDARALIDRAELHRRLGDGRAMLEDATRLVERLPGNVGGWHGLGVARIHAGDWTGARAALDEALRLAGDTPAAASSLQHRAACHRHAKELAAARVDLERAVELEPALWGAWNDLGLVLGQLGDLEGARAAHTRSLDLARGTDRVDPLLSRATLLRSAKEPALALADLDEAVGLAPGRWDVWSARGWLRTHTGDHQGALGEFERAIALAPKEAAPLRGRGIALRSLERWDEAEADATRAIELAPRTAEMWAFRGGLRLRRDDARGAEEDLTRAIDLGYLVAGVLRQRSQARRDLGDLDGAIADLGLLLEREPRSVEALVTRAILLRDWRRDLDAAARDEDAALAADPTSSAAHRSRAMTRLLRGDRAGARASADEAFELAPTSDFSLATRAQVLLGLGEPAAALADAERAVTLDPGSSYAHWAHGQALLARGDAAGAVAACGRAIQLDGRGPRALATRAQALVALGRPTDALADLDRAVALEPGRPDPLLERAALRERTGDRAAAAADLRAALALLRTDDPRRRATSAALARLAP